MCDCQSAGLTYLSSQMLAKVVGFSLELSPYFESLNRAWIEEYFEIEEADLTVLGDPFKEIIERGGQIFFVVSDGKAFGTCAVIRLSDDVYELAKMAVAAEARGLGYGDLLIEAAIEFARETGAQRLILLSNTRLKPAIALYQKHGFRSVPITDA